MPDSYSSGGTWFMEFASRFDATGKGYANSPAGTARHSIGILLHYAHGPDKFNLLACDASVTHSVANCKTPPTDILHTQFTQLDNTGTLDIVMKAPESEDACDPHVRSAYPTMLKVIDPTPLKSGRNINQSIGYSEPAINEDAGGKPVYETNSDTTQNSCFSNDDPQNPSYRANGSNDIKSMSAATHDPLDVQLNTIVTNLKDLVDKDGEDAKGLLSREIATHVRESRSEVSTHFAVDADRTTLEHVRQLHTR
jgi:hypothetical protein